MFPCERDVNIGRTFQKCIVGVTSAKNRQKLNLNRFNKNIQWGEVRDGKKVSSRK